MFELNNDGVSASDSSTAGEDAAAFFWAENSQRRVLSISLIISKWFCITTLLGESWQELLKGRTVYSLVIWAVVAETLPCPTV